MASGYGNEDMLAEARMLQAEFGLGNTRGRGGSGRGGVATRGGGGALTSFPRGGGLASGRGRGGLVNSAPGGRPGRGGFTSHGNVTTARGWGSPASLATSPPAHLFEPQSTNPTRVAIYDEMMDIDPPVDDPKTTMASHSTSTKNVAKGAAPIVTNHIDGGMEVDIPAGSQSNNKGRPTVPAPRARSPGHGLGNSNWASSGTSSMATAKGSSAPPVLRSADLGLSASRWASPSLQKKVKVDGQESASDHGLILIDTDWQETYRLEELLRRRREAGLDTADLEETLRQRYANITRPAERTGPAQPVAPSTPNLAGVAMQNQYRQHSTKSVGQGIDQTRTEPVQAVETVGKTTAVPATPNNVNHGHIQVQTKQTSRMVARGPVSHTPSGGLHAQPVQHAAAAIPPGGPMSGVSQPAQRVAGEQSSRPTHDFGGSVGQQQSTQPSRPVSGQRFSRPVQSLGSSGGQQQSDQPNPNSGVQRSSEPRRPGGGQDIADIFRAKDAQGAWDNYMGRRNPRA